MLEVGIGLLTLCVILICLCTVCLIQDSDVSNVNLYTATYDRYSYIEDSQKMREEFDSMEEYVMYIAYHLTDCKCEFIKVHPDFLYYEPSGRCLELDGYAKDINGKRVAIEYMGEYHDTPNVHNNYGKDLDVIKHRDRFKKMKCIEEGIIYIDLHHSIKPGKVKRELFNYFYRYGLYN